MRTIPLLPSPVNLDRDASRSAKQEMARKEIRKSTLNSLVDLPEFEVITYKTPLQKGNNPSSKSRFFNIIGTCSNQTKNTFSQTCSVQ